MKAAILEEIGRPLIVGDAPRPEIGPDDVLVETRTCGICRTDVHIQDGLAYVPHLPHVPGHEPAGVVTEVGSNVTNVSVGDRVVPHLFMSCGTCPYCRRGLDAQCSQVAGIIGVTTGGGFAEFFKAPAENLLPIPAGVSFAAAGLASCAVVTAVHAYRRAAVSVGDAVLVLGAGGIGQILVQILKHAGARVSVVSRSIESLQIAENLGADLCLQADDRAVDTLQGWTAGEGVDVVFECVGLGATMQFAAAAARRCGRIVVIGEEAEHPAVDTIQIAQRELEIIGSRNGSKQDAADALRWMAQGVINPPIAARLPLASINEGLDHVRHGTVHGRVVIDVRDDA